MAKYRLTNKAVEDLSKIWEYTVEVWSENQADKYYFELLEDCQLVSDNKSIARKYGEILEDVYGYNSGQHVIFFRIISENEIEIIRFLHSRMDLKNRIQE